MSNIDRTPVSQILMTMDTLCPSEANEYIYGVIPTKEKYLRFEKGDHFIYSFDMTEDEIDRMVQTIEFGKVDSAYTSSAYRSFK